MRSFSNGLLRSTRKDNGPIKTFGQLYAGADLTLLNKIRAGQYVYCNEPVFIDDGGAGQVIPSIYTASAEPDFIATVSGPIKSYGTDIKRYIGYVSHRPLGWSELWLYDSGDEKTVLTGGWDANYCTYANYLQNGRTLLTKNVDNFYGILTNHNQIKYRGTVSKIDVSKISTLYANIDYIDKVNTGARFFLTPNSDANYSSANGGTDPAVITSIESNFNGNASLDVTALTGSYYLFIVLVCWGSSGGVGAELTVKEIWGV